MIDMNMGNFKHHLDSFSTETGNNFIGQNIDLLLMSKGPLITEINDCLTAYSDFCDNIDKVYLSTLNYLNTAYYNINACEENNTV